MFLACAALFILQLHFFRQTFVRDLQALAEVVAANCTGPVSFGDKKAAEEVLAMVKDLRKGTDAATAREKNARLQSIEGDADKLELELRIRYRIDGMLYEAAIPPSIIGSSTADSCRAAMWRRHYRRRPGT